MNKAVMVRKALNLTDLREKQCGQRPESIIIEKKIILSSGEYADLCENFFKRQDYIVGNGDIMYQDNEGWHCILAYNEGSDTGIVISSEGYDFARYAGEVKISEITIKPEVKIKWCGKEETDEILEKFNVKIFKRYGQYIIDQTNSDNLLRINVDWKNKKAV